MGWLKQRYPSPGVPKVSEAPIVDIDPLG
jgi:hypothetical protein